MPTHANPSAAWPQPMEDAAEENVPSTAWPCPADPAAHSGKWAQERQNVHSGGPLPSVSPHHPVRVDGDSHLAV